MLTKYAGNKANSASFVVILEVEAELGNKAKRFEIYHTNILRLSFHSSN